jgi:hypothetical protein
LPYAIDGRVSLRELVDTALNALEGDKRPKFILVEASKIGIVMLIFSLSVISFFKPLKDLCAHANDAACIYHETEDYYQAFETAVEYANTHENTVVLGTSDHETGGLSYFKNINLLPFFSQCSISSFLELFRCLQNLSLRFINVHIISS